MIGFGCGEVVRLDDVAQDRAHRDETRRARFMRLAAGRMPTTPPPYARASRSGPAHRRRERGDLERKGRGSCGRRDGLQRMSLNIKDPEAHRLAQKIARATGETMTRVVTEALRERLEKIERSQARASVEELLTIADWAAAHVKGPYLDHAALLYDKHGLSK